MLSKDDVLRIAGLARLELTAEEIERYRRDLGRVLESMRSLDAVPTDASLVVRHVPKDSVPFREDKPLPFANGALLLENAPDQAEGCFRLPAILEGDE
jgi:aspartyl-tRNA(Asn)/glutamyl-tRNA(Gln) amidotransferase subunit C